MSITLVKPVFTSLCNRNVEAYKKYLDCVLSYNGAFRSFVCSCANRCHGAGDSQSQSDAVNSGGSGGVDHNSDVDDSRSVGVSEVEEGKHKSVPVVKTLPRGPNYERNVVNRAKAKLRRAAGSVSGVKEIELETAKQQLEISRLFREKQEQQLEISQIYKEQQKARLLSISAQVKSGESTVADSDLERGLRETWAERKRLENELAIKRASQALVCWDDSSSALERRKEQARLRDEYQSTALGDKMRKLREVTQKKAEAAESAAAREVHDKWLQDASGTPSASASSKGVSAWSGSSLGSRKTAASGKSMVDEELYLDMQQRYYAEKQRTNELEAKVFTQRMELEAANDCYNAY